MSIEVGSATDSADAVSAVNSELAKPKDAGTKTPEAKVEASTEAEEILEDSETSNEDAEETDSEDESESDESDDADETGKEQKPKKKGGFQKRIAKLNERASRAEQERDRLAAELAERTKPAPAETTKKATAPAEGRPTEAQFDTHEEYEDAVAEWRFDQREKAKAAKDEIENAKTAYQSQVKSIQQKVQEYAKANPEFKELIPDVAHIKILAPLEEALYSSENAPELMHELAKNPAELERINALGLVAVHRELGKIEARLALAASTESKPQEKKTTKAPPPIAPVGGKGAGAGKKTIFDPNLSQAEYESLRRSGRRA